MEELTNLMRIEIKRQYRSVRHFAIVLGIPQSTVVTALNKGVRGTAFETVVRMCEALDIKLAIGDESVYIEKDCHDIIKAYNSLDEVGRHTVKTIVYVENMRCHGIELPELSEQTQEQAE